MYTCRLLSFAETKLIIADGYVLQGVAKVKALVDEEVIPRIRNAVARVANELAIPGEMNHMLVDEIFRGVDDDRDALASTFADALFPGGGPVETCTCRQCIILNP
jgi:5,10-methenyltetrahydromethanopterin hydrogenase